MIHLSEHVNLAELDIQQVFFPKLWTTFVFEAMKYSQPRGATGLSAVCDCGIS